jgi:hypothetical protein
VESPNECGRCAELELVYLNRTDEFISLVERQGRMFRNGEAKIARALDDAVSATKAAMHEGLRAWAEHRESHFTATQG